MKTLTIDRKKWVNGNNCSYSYNPTAGISALLNREGYMCCLGFACMQLLGKSEAEISCVSYPFDLNELSIFTEKDSYGQYNHTRLASMAASINDNRLTTREYKEEALIDLFAQYDIKVEFIN